MNTMYLAFKSDILDSLAQLTLDSRNLNLGLCGYDWCGYYRQMKRFASLQLEYGQRNVFEFKVFY